ncbi:hypothetical protein [Paraburkholderia saeva]|uniref:Uncharacterized protein n=1 Tax=Paraburkholderia saeva TaxID=2777537 RepID=A0A9N8X3B8_9BURK|nr:hypothetical protein [Paraburkholderia saeva]CAG4900536.1 hypothetical protein LMG31841_02889 [Paraburkholderia saeva]
MNRDLKYERLRSPRTLSDAFGPYAKLHVEPEKTPLRAYVWMVVWGVGIGAIWYVITAIKAGAL